MQHHHQNHRHLLLDRTKGSNGKIYTPVVVTAAVLVGEARLQTTISGTVATGTLVRPTQQQ